MHIAIAIDHLLIGCPNLEAGCDYAEELFGARPEPGGSHPAVGTRNALLGLESGVYIELIAPDSGQSSDLPLSHYLGQLPGPELLWWASRCTDIQRIDRTLAEFNVTTGQIETWSRRRPDGTQLHWQLLMPADAGLGPAMPFFIRWDDMREHPARFLPVVGSLEVLQVIHPDQATGESPVHAMVADRIAVVTGATSALCATICTPGGVVVLRSPSTDVPAIGSIR